MANPGIASLVSMAMSPFFFFFLTACASTDDQIIKTTQEETMAKKLRVYVASPYGFAESTRDFMKERFLRAITNAGCEVLDPWRHTLPDQPQLSDLMRLGELNAKDIEDARGLVAALDGPDVDSGTAAEIGYAAANGKWIIGYRGDFRHTGEGPQVTVNLQVEYFIRKTRGEIVRTLEDLTKALRRRCKS